MSDVRRFDFDVTGCQVEDPLGGYVDHDDYSKLEAEVQSLRADAERYRWLRAKCHLFEHYRAMKWRPDAFETEIDNAMRASKA